MQIAVSYKDGDNIQFASIRIDISLELKLFRASNKLTDMQKLATS